ncbi:expressed unknown protein [Seminavis robusta]|uniref:Calmodulin n=1 Tax=Seminavis robusta TaxID=568900 RepID=A0A9N8E0P1_9STRA|nr:expressed unknown protein [Seminavis robusta]|eukprot:Sro419_g139090.1 n/a (542) ;mRNA; f:34991-36616
MAARLLFLLSVSLLCAYRVSAFLVVHPNRGSVDLSLLRGAKQRIKAVWSKTAWGQRRRTVDQNGGDNDLASLENAFAKSEHQDHQQVYGYYYHHNNMGSNGTMTLSTGNTMMEEIPSVVASSSLATSSHRTKQMQDSYDKNHVATSSPASITAATRPANGRTSRFFGLLENGKDSSRDSVIDSTGSGKPVAVATTESPASQTTPTSIQTLQSPSQQQSTSTTTTPLEPMYTLPPLSSSSSSLSKLELEFRNMLAFFGNYTRADLYTVRDPRTRTILEGVISSSDEPAVYRAFEVLFEDLPPLRLAGRMIFAKLEQVMQQAAATGQAQVDLVVNQTGIPHGTCQKARLAFLTLAVATEYGHHKEPEAHLTTDQLVSTGLASIAMDLLRYDDNNHQQFLATLDREQSGRVTFSDFMIGIQTMAEETCGIEHCDPAQILQTVANEMEPAFLRSNRHAAMDQKRQEHSDRYDRMVTSFQEWDDVVPTGEGRRLDVLRGCFVGARNKPVVEALRVVYIDYVPLRMAGNSIFALTKSLVSQIRKRSK